MMVQFLLLEILYFIKQISNLLDVFFHNVCGLTLSILSVVERNNNAVPVLPESVKRKEAYHFLFASSITDKIPLNEAAAPTLWGFNHTASR